MANLNLSQFGENSSVSDADYTFVWDSANAISKKVSRNSWLNSGTLTSDAPVTISQTWNQIGTAFTAFKVNAVSTASASGSLLLDLQVGTVSQFNVRKNGQALFSSGIVSAPGITFLSGSNTGIWETSAGVQFSSAGTNAFGIRNEIRVNGSLAFGFASGTPADTGLDVALWRDSASGNTLALRNGAAAQTFNVYGTSSASNANYARLALTCGLDGNATISTQALGTGTAGTVSINGVPVGLGKGNVSSNVAVGFQVLNANTSGLANTGFGYASLQNTAGGSGNSGVGFAALQFNTSGNTNSGFGQNALNANTSGNSNTGIGVNSFFSNTTGSFNLAIGFSAGRFITGGSTANALANNSIYLGADTKAAASGETNQIVIGYDATGIGSNSVVLGNDSITKTALKGNVGIGTTAPSTLLEVALTPTGSTLGQGIKLSRGSGYFSLANGTSGAGFLPSFTGKGTITAAAYALLFEGISGSDADNSNPVVLFATKNNAGSAGVGNSQTAYQFENYITPLLTIKGSGNVGIGTTSPTSKLHVAGTIKPEQATMVDKAAGFTLAAVDAGTVINSTSATAITINLPAADTAAGYNVMIIQSGAGAVTIAANGNTLNSFGSAFTTAGQHAACSIVRTAASTYNLSGNLV